MAETRQRDRGIDQFNADQTTAARQVELFRRIILIEWQMLEGIRGIGGAYLAEIHMGGDGEKAAGPEGMGGTDKVAGIAGLAHALNTDREKTTHQTKTIQLSLSNWSKPIPSIMIDPVSPMSVTDWLLP